LGTRTTWSRCCCWSQAMNRARAKPRSLFKPQTA
jgi:hypothetical protein